MTGHRTGDAGPGTGDAIVLEPLDWWDIPTLVQLEAALFPGDSPWNAEMFWSELAAGHHYVVHRDPAGLIDGYAGLALIGDEAEVHTVLYIEDNPANMELVERLVERRSDLRLLKAGNGSSGIALARMHLPQVILMDINLPGISGIQALRTLAQDPSTAHIPVIALSANAMPRDIEKGLAAGFFRYLTKPIKVNQFMDTLDETLKFSLTTLDRAAKEKQA